MKTELACIPCILDDVIGASEQLSLPLDVRLKVVREVLVFLEKECDLSEPPSYAITGAHRILKRVSGIDVPFQDLRRRANRVGVRLAGKIAEEAAGLTDAERFRRLVIAAVAGNELDFRTIGTGYGLTGSDIEARLRDAIRRPLAVDEIGPIREAAEGAQEILFVHDNVGEIAFDRVLIEELRRSGSRVFSVLRGGPISSDAVVADGKEVGLEEVSGIIEAGPDTLGISYREMSPELASALSRTELVFSKGQANYYVLSAHRGEIPGRIVYLLRTKCDLVASEFGSQGKVSIAAISSHSAGGRAVYNDRKK